MNNSTIQRIPLSTEAQIDAAYPEHKKLRDLEPQIKQLEQFAWALHKKGLVLARYYEDDLEGRTLDEVDLKLEPSAGMQEFVWTHLGIDPKKIWAEKDSMFAQLRLAQEDAK